MALFGQPRGCSAFVAWPKLAVAFHAEAMPWLWLAMAGYSHDMLAATFHLAGQLAMLVSLWKGTHDFPAPLTDIGVPIVGRI
jgi:hypothetical protein